MPTDKASIIKLSILGLLIIVAGLQLFGVLGWDSDTLDSQCESIEAATAKLQQENQQLKQQLDDLTAQVQALPEEADIEAKEKTLKERLSEKRLNLQNIRIQQSLPIFQR